MAQNNQENMRIPLLALRGLHVFPGMLLTFDVGHTFGTMMLTLGADLFTTSKLMGHSNIQTTEIYAKIVDKKKEEAINLIDGMFT